MAHDDLKRKICPGCGESLTAQPFTWSPSRRQWWHRDCLPPLDGEPMEHTKERAERLEEIQRTAQERPLIDIQTIPVCMGCGWEGSWDDVELDDPEDDPAYYWRDPTEYCPQCHQDLLGEKEVA